jgi:peptidoglycan biosynthesis protein MviN/MurJ (putative lipid II flippase)
VVLASSLSGTALALVIAGYLALVLIVYVIRPRDVQGRRRAVGCIVGLVLFFGLFVVAAAYWAADHVFS